MPRLRISWVPTLCRVVFDKSVRSGRFAGVFEQLGHLGDAGASLWVLPRLKAYQEPSILWTTSLTQHSAYFAADQWSNEAQEIKYAANVLFGFMVLRSQVEVALFDFHRLTSYPHPIICHGIQAKKAHVSCSEGLISRWTAQKEHFSRHPYLGLGGHWSPRFFTNYHRASHDVLRTLIQE